MLIRSAGRPQCRAYVYKRDAYRRTGRGTGGFSLHYSREQCSRVANGGDLCWQHQRMERQGWWLARAALSSVGAADGG